MNGFDGMLIPGGEILEAETLEFIHLFKGYNVTPGEIARHLCFLHCEDERTNGWDWYTIAARICERIEA